MRTFLVFWMLVSNTLAFADLKSDIADRYRQWDAAYFQRDVKKMAAILHPKFQIVTGSGKTIDRKGYVASLWKAKLPEVYETTLLRVQAKRKRCLAWTRERAKQAGEKVNVHRYQDTWLKVNGQWLLFESRTLGED